MPWLYYYLASNRFEAWNGLILAIFDFVFLCITMHHTHPIVGQHQDGNFRKYQTLYNRKNSSNHSYVRIDELYLSKPGVFERDTTNWFHTNTRKHLTMMYASIYWARASLTKGLKKIVESFIRFDVKIATYRKWKTDEIVIKRFKVT